MRALISVASAVLLRWASQELKDVLKSQRIASEVGPRQCQSERLHGRFQAPAVVQRQNFATGGALYGIALYAGDGGGITAMVSLPSRLRCFGSIAEENSARRKGQPG